MPRTCAVALLSVALLVGASAPAWANPDFKRAKELLDNLDFDKAADAFKKALDAGDNDAATTAEIYLHLGEIEASVGDEKQAIKHFSRALSIDINIKLPPGTSPKVGKPFGTARRGIDDPLAAKVVVDRSGEAVKATLEIANDVNKMVRSAAVTYKLLSGEESNVELRLKKAKTPLLLPAKVSSIAVAVLDRRGNHLVELEPVNLESDEEGDDDDGGNNGNNNGNNGNNGGGTITKKGGGGGSFVTRWYLWGGLAVAAAGAGVAFGLSTQSTLDELDQLKSMSTMEMVEGSEAVALEDKARSRALLTNISFAAAGAFAIAAGVFFFTSSGDAPATESAVSLTPTFGNDEVGVLSTFRF